MPSGHLSGGKFTASHTTVIDAAYAPALAASELACVRKIALGMIQSLRGGPPALTFREESPGCLLVKVRGRRSLQELRVYATDHARVQAVMEAVFTA